MKHKTSRVKLKDNSDDFYKHQELAFACKLRQPILKPAAGDQYDLTKILSKFTSVDYHFLEVKNDFY